MKFDFCLGSKKIMEFISLSDAFPTEEGSYVLKIKSGYALCPTLCQCIECIADNTITTTHWMKLINPEY